jgi:uncharacterized membrane protein
MQSYLYKWLFRFVRSLVKFIHFVFTYIGRTSLIIYHDIESGDSKKQMQTNFMSIRRGYHNNNYGDVRSIFMFRIFQNNIEAFDL